MKLSICGFLALVYLNLQGTTAATDKVFCYWESWSSLAPEDIDVDICTHIMYSFMGINEDGSLRLDGDADYLTRLSNLKNTNPNVKIILSVGGWGEGSIPFSDVAVDDEKINNMVKSTISYLDEYDLDGLDIDWEYPSERGGLESDKENFITMLSALREAFDEPSRKYTLTVAVWGIPSPTSYNVNVISNIVDYINVMSYDLHHSTDNHTGQTSPLYGSPADDDYEKEYLSCDAAINNWMNMGAAPSKLILGLAFYTISFTLADPQEHQVGDPTTGPGSYAGLSYGDLCGLDNEGWTTVWDDDQENPYMYSGDQWIGYDNPTSIGLKVQYAKNRNLGGVMMWAIDLDDHKGECGPKYPLLNAIKDNL